jgi:hypothetical protein
MAVVLPRVGTIIVSASARGRVFPVWNGDGEQRWWGGGAYAPRMRRIDGDANRLLATFSFH